MTYLSENIPKLDFEFRWLPALAPYYHEGDYMAEEPWCLYHGRKGV